MAENLQAPNNQREINPPGTGAAPDATLSDENFNDFASGIENLTRQESQGPSFWHKIKGVVYSILLLLIAPALALFLTLFVFQSYEVDGPSMESALQHKDRLIVLKLPRTVARITRKAYIPNRGDIVIFNVSTDNSIESGAPGRQLIKRVIALPGERVVINDRVVTVFNSEFPGGFQPDKTGAYSLGPNTITEGNVDLTVKEGEVFVMGDNRANSLDSRVFGAIAASDVIGKLVLRVYPLDKIDKF